MATLDTLRTMPAVVSRPRRVLRAIGRGLYALLAAIIVLGMCGATYEALAATGDTERYPPPGRLIDVGGFQMHIHCVGTGSPTVLLEGGNASPALSWMLVQPEAAHTSRVCTYDRAGLGWSEPSSAPRTPQQIASELHTLLQNAGIDGPYVLVGASLGGKYVREYARQYPADVVGVVFVDARHESFDRESPAYSTQSDRILPLMNRLFWLWGRVGLARLVGSPLGGYDAVSDADNRQLTIISLRPAALAASEAEYFARGAHDATIDGETHGDRPVIVLAAGQGGMMLDGWAEAQEHMARLSTRGRLVVLPESGHAIQADAPGAIVAAIAEVVASIR